MDREALKFSMTRQDQHSTYKCRTLLQAGVLPTPSGYFQTGIVLFAWIACKKNQSLLSLHQSLYLDVIGEKAKAISTSTRSANRRKGIWPVDFSSWSLGLIARRSALQRAGADCQPDTRGRSILCADEGFEGKLRNLAGPPRPVSLSRFLSGTSPLSSPLHSSSSWLTLRFFPRTIADLCILQCFASF